MTVKKNNAIQLFSTMQGFFPRGKGVKKINASFK